MKEGKANHPARALDPLSEIVHEGDSGSSMQLACYFAEQHAACMLLQVGRGGMLSSGRLAVKPSAALTTLLYAGTFEVRFGSPNSPA